MNFLPATTTEGPLNTQNWTALSNYLVVGKGNPEGFVKGRVGTIFLRADGEPGKTIYVKGEGEGTTEGWEAFEGSKGGGFATIKELVEEAEKRAAGDGILSALISAEEAARVSADSTLTTSIATEKSQRESADSTEKAEREAADLAEKLLREIGDNERIKGPGSFFGVGGEFGGAGNFGEAVVADGNLTVWDGASGTQVKDGGNFEERAEAIRLDQFAAPTSDVSWGGKKITNLGEPSEELDATNKAYVDAVGIAAAAGLALKAPVAYASTANLASLSTAELITALPVNDSLLKASIPAAFTKLPWSESSGTFSEANGWSSIVFTSEFSPAGSKSGIFWNTEKLKGGNAAIGFKRTTSGGSAGRQLGAWLFTEAEATPSGYQLAVVAESGTKAKFILRKWIAGVETKMAETKEVAFGEQETVFLVARAGKVSAWLKHEVGSFELVGSEVADATFSEGYSAMDGNGGMRAINFTTGTLAFEGTAPLVIDGIAPPAIGSRVLLKNQTLEAQNGIYTVTKNEAFGGEGEFGGGGEFGKGSKWRLTRATDADTTAEVVQGMFVLVTGGSTNANSTWVLSSPNPILVGASDETFGQFTARPIGAAEGDLSGTYPAPSIKEGAVVNADVNASAAIAYSKLNLALAIVNADISASAAIAYSKLNLAASIVAADLATGAKQLFPQLLSAATRKINFAAATVEWGGGSPNSKETTVTHELGATPLSVTCNSESQTIIATKTYGATTFKIAGRTGDGSSPVAGVKETVHWIAIG